MNIPPTRERCRALLHQFGIERVAAMIGREPEHGLLAPGIARNRPKVALVRDNMRAALQLMDAEGSLDRFRDPSWRDAGCATACAGRWKSAVSASSAVPSATPPTCSTVRSLRPPGTRPAPNPVASPSTGLAKDRYGSTAGACRPSIAVRDSPESRQLPVRGAVPAHGSPCRNASFRSRGNCLIAHSARDALARLG